MKKLIFTAAFLLLASCGDDTNSPAATISNDGSKPSNNMSEDLSQKGPSEVQQLTSVAAGSGKACLTLDIQALNCSSTLTGLDDQSLPQATYTVPVELVSSEGQSYYQLSDPNQAPLDLSELEDRLEAQPNDYADYEIYKKIKNNPEDFYYFLSQISGENTIDASGAVHQVEVKINDEIIPVAYSTNCMDDQTEFHTVVGRYGLKIAYKLYDTNPDRYQLQVSGLKKVSDKIIKHTAYCTVAPMNQAAEIVEDDIDNLADEAEQVANDAEEKSEEVADEINAEVAEVADQVSDEAAEVKDDAEETVEEIGAEVAEEADEVAAEIGEAAEDAEDTVEEIGAEVVEGAENIEQNIDEATQETQTEAQEAVSAIEHAAKETGEAIEQGLIDAGQAIEAGAEKVNEAGQELAEDIERGAEVAAEKAEDAADATTEALADGLAVTDEFLNEGAAVIAGTSEAIAEKVEDTVEAAIDSVDENVEEARQENDRRDDNAVVRWLRNLFN